mmetsp:Transcript_124/g.936  ORF Transcript_124/g.936 Transcript_124/m.936 type:complete len:315 (+) Transcript_124:419-1363(+)
MAQIRTHGALRRVLLAGGLEVRRNMLAFEEEVPCGRAIQPATKCATGPRRQSGGGGISHLRFVEHVRAEQRLDGRDVPPPSKMGRCHDGVLARIGQAIGVDGRSERRTHRRGREPSGALSFRHVGEGRPTTLGRRSRTARIHTRRTSSFLGSFATRKVGGCVSEAASHAHARRIHVARQSAFLRSFLRQRHAHRLRAGVGTSVSKRAYRSHRRTRCGTQRFHGFGSLSSGAGGAVEQGCVGRRRDQEAHRSNRRMRRTFGSVTDGGSRGRMVDGWFGVIHLHYNTKTSNSGSPKSWFRSTADSTLFLALSLNTA